MRVVSRDPPPPPLLVFPGVADIEIVDRVDDPGDAVIVMECGDLARTGVAGLERGFVINIDHHLGNTMYGAINWFDVSAAACGEMVFDLVRRARRAADHGDRDAHLRGDPHRHRVVPLLEHHAAHVRDLPAVRRGRRRTRRPWRAAIFDSNNLGRLKLFGAVLSRMQLDADRPPRHV